MNQSEVLPAIKSHLNYVYTDKCRQLARLMAEITEQNKNASS